MSDILSLLNFSGNKKLPLILQTEMAECGLACLAMTAGYYGYKLDILTLRSAYPISLKGVSLQSLMEVADHLKFSSRALRLELDDMVQLRTPAILHWNMNHFVVLKKAGKGHIIIHNPAVGLQKISYAEASKHFTGVALELIPASDFEKKDEQIKMRLSQFWQRITGLYTGLAKIFFLSLLIQVFALAAPFYLQLVVDEVLISHDINLLLVLALGFGVVALINVLTSALRSFTLLHLGSVISIQMAANLFRHLIRLPLEFFEKRHMGDLVSRFGSLEKVKQVFTTELIEAVIDGIMTVATLVLMFIYSPSLTLIVLIVVGLYIGVRTALYRPYQQKNEEVIVATAKENTNFMETARAIQTIKLFGRESDRQALWQNRYADSMNATIKIGKLDIIYKGINALLFSLENVIVIYLAARLVMQGQLSVGMLFAFIAYKTQFSSRAGALVDRIVEFKMIGLHLNRLADIALAKEEKIDNGQNIDFDFKGGIELNNISYRYSQNEPYVIQGLSLKVGAGSSVAIVGPSGCGKTTLVKLMLGLVQPAEGVIKVDGINIRHIGVKSYRTRVAAVMQEDQLLTGSLSDNISFFDPVIDMQQVEACAKLASIYDEIMAMPMGFNSLVGDMGNTLSGGQKQRVLLARALYRNPRILFLDEATSHLDIHLESMVNTAIKKLNITRVIIAHRPETIKSADVVFDISHKEIRETQEQ